MILLKAVKWGVISLGTTAAAGGLIFGNDLVSYVSSAARSVQSSVTDAVPMEFQLRRAKDLLDDIIPEMHANIRAIAQQEVEIDQLKEDIAQSQTAVHEQVAQVEKLRDTLSGSEASFTFGQINYTREQVKDDLADRLETVKESELVLAGKQRLLENREQSLGAAMNALDRAKEQKSLLESQIASLEGQYKLLQTASVGSSIQVDNSKLAQTERLIAQIKTQLDVSQRVLAHEAKFADPIQVPASEQDVMAEANDFLASAQTQPAGVSVAQKPAN